MLRGIAKRIHDSDTLFKRVFRLLDTKGYNPSHLFTLTESNIYKKLAMNPEEAMYKSYREYPQEGIRLKGLPDFTSVPDGIELVYAYDEDFIVHYSVLGKRYSDNLCLSDFLSERYQFAKTLHEWVLGLPSTPFAQFWNQLSQFLSIDCSLSVHEAGACDESEA